MNVFGKTERSWRKARKRGVSPIIATILLVAITVVLAAVLYVLISGLTSGGVGSKPIGGAFSAGGAVVNNPSAGNLAANGCLGGVAGTGHYCYTLTVESSSVTFSNVLFEVKTSTGAVLSGVVASGFSILNIAGVVVAQSATGTSLAMTSSFSAGTGWGLADCNSATCGASTPLTSIYTIVIDMGITTNPTGLGYSFVTIGTGGYSGTTAISLP